MPAVFSWLPQIPQWASAGHQERQSRRGRGARRRHDLGDHRRDGRHARVGHGGGSHPSVPDTGGGHQEACRRVQQNATHAVREEALYGVAEMATEVEEGV